MKDYELSVVFHPDLEMNLTPATDKIKKLIEDNGGTITKETNEGKRHLAYRVKGHDFAIYYYYEIDLPAPAPAKINSVLAITDEVIRSLLVTVDPLKLKAEAKKAARRANSDKSEDDPVRPGRRNDHGKEHAEQGDAKGADDPHRQALAVDARGHPDHPAGDVH